MLEKLIITVSGTRFTDDGKVHIDFRGRNQERNINVNGYIPDVDMMDFFQNADSIDDIELFVRKELINALSDEEVTVDDIRADEPADNGGEEAGTMSTMSTQESGQEEGETKRFQVAGETEESNTTRNTARNSNKNSK